MLLTISFLSNLLFYYTILFLILQELFSYLLNKLPERYIFHSMLLFVFPLSLRTCQCRGLSTLLFVCAKSNQKRTGGCRPYGYPALTRLPHSKLHALQLRQTRRRINRRIWSLYRAYVCTSKYSHCLILRKIRNVSHPTKAAIKPCCQCRTRPPFNL